MCVCKVDDLEQICNRECRIKQKKILQYVCTKPIKIRVTFADGTYVSTDDFYFSESWLRITVSH